MSELKMGFYFNFISFCKKYISEDNMCFSSQQPQIEEMLMFPRIICLVTSHLFV